MACQECEEKNNWKPNYTTLASQLQAANERINSQSGTIQRLKERENRVDKILVKDSQLLQAANEQIRRMREALIVINRISGERKNAELDLHQICSVTKEILSGSGDGILCDCGQKATIIKGGFQICQKCYDEIMNEYQEPYSKETVL